MVIKMEVLKMAELPQMWIQLDSKHFCLGLSSSKMYDDDVLVYINPDAEIGRSIRKYRYDIENDEFIYDESNVLEELKQNAKVRHEFELKESGQQRFSAIVDGKEVFFNFNDDIKNTLMTAYSMINSSLLEKQTLECFDKDGNDIIIDASISSIGNILKSLMNFQSELIKERHEFNMSIDNATSIKEIEEITENTKE